MKVFVDKKMMGRNNYPKLIKEFPDIEFVEEDDIEDIEVAVCMPYFFKNHDVFKLGKLKWIQYLMAGFDTVDIEKLTRKNIKFSNAQDIFSTSIAEDVFTKIFYFNRNVKHYYESMKTASWEPIRKEPELTGATIGILGVGSIGKEIAKRMIPFGVEKVIGYRQSLKPEQYFDEIYTGEEGLKKVLNTGDYIIVALPLNDSTYQIMNEKTFKEMKNTALIINVGRGGLVNQKDLINSLKNKMIRGAGLDVTDPEPLPKGNPLWSLDNVYITPHNASSSPFMKDRLFKLTVENLHNYLENKPVKYLLN